ncbi:MAG: PAS domain S-box protein [Bacillota bacterium]
MLVSELMESIPEVLTIQDMVYKDANKFSSTNEEELPVVNAQQAIIGVVTKKSLLNAIGTPDNICSSIDTILEKPHCIVQMDEEIHKLTLRTECNVLWVVDENDILVGLLRQHKINQVLVEEELSNKSFKQFNTIDPKDVTPLESSSLFTSILESSFDGIWIANGKGDTLYVNNSYERITGLKREDLIGKNIRQLLEQKLFSQSTVLLAIEQRAPVSIIHKYVTGKSTLTTGNPVFNKNGDIVRVVCNVRDISELVKLRNELAETEVTLLLLTWVEPAWIFA